jgi:hypothetical protein
MTGKTHIPMDPSHTHAHIIGDIATVKNRIHKAIEVDLRDSLVVSSLPIVSPAHREPEDTTSALPYFMQLFLGSSSFAVVVKLHPYSLIEWAVFGIGVAALVYYK